LGFVEKASQEFQAKDDHGCTDQSRKSRSTPVLNQQQARFNGDNGEAKAKEHPLSLWIRVAPGDRLVITRYGLPNVVGLLECRSNDGLIIWIRDELNDRKMIHFRDCRSFVLVE
jgi:hypothetical protein